jgi:hypothetical protein
MPTLNGLKIDWKNDKSELIYQLVCYLKRHSSLLKN